MKQMVEFRRSLNRATSLARRRFLLPRPASFFKPDWYLAQYPDVAAISMDPWIHFHLHGRGEGRFASHDHLEMWFSDRHFQQVRSLFLSDAGTLSPPDRDYLQWLLARRFALSQCWSDVAALYQPGDLKRRARGSSAFRHLPAVLYADALRHLQLEDESARTIEWLKKSYPGVTDIRLLEANHRVAFEDNQSGYTGWLQVVNEMYADHGRAQIALAPGEAPPMDRLVPSRRLAVGDDGRGSSDRPLISVLVPAYNATGTIQSALSSIQAQTWRDLEIIVIDDGSNDGTAEVVHEAARTDARVRFERLLEQRGAYPARNRGLELARGDYITVHDADDWSHPQKIEIQMRHLQANQSLKGCVSSWVRMQPELYFGGWDHPGAWSGWVHMNNSSFLFSREVFETLGYWDEVACGADTEYIDRVRTAWGESSVGSVTPRQSLSFARITGDSLTQASQTHILTMLKGPRFDYHKAYLRWHRGARTPEELYRHRGQRNRPYPVPEAMRLGGATQQVETPEDSGASPE
ncbi:MAG: glycosyltransferase family A protein [Xanthomonadales bacterium]|nr:glycosyltransferase family A protein [Xanthomonadales bacterium]